MSIAYCTCHVNYHHTNFKKTIADEDGKCMKCGYHAIFVSSHELYPRPVIGSKGKGCIHGFRPIFNSTKTWNIKGRSAILRKEICDII